MPKDKKDRKKSQSQPQHRTETERLQVVNETKLKLLEHDIADDPASKVLWMMMDRYVKTGNPVIDVSLFMKRRYDIERKFLVNLYNDRKKKDVVLIRAMTPDEISKSSRTSARRPEIPVATTGAAGSSMPIGVGGDWDNRAYAGVNPDIDSDEEDDECPELEPGN